MKELAALISLIFWRTCVLANVLPRLHTKWGGHFLPLNKTGPLSQLPMSRRRRRSFALVCRRLKEEGKKEYYLYSKFGY